MRCAPPRGPKAGRRPTLADHASESRLVAAAAARADALLAPRPRGVINATGVVVHTNLGRSVLSAAAADAVRDLATDAMDLEFDLERGRRGSRHAHLSPLWGQLFPEHSAFVVNNNAAATLLTLRALAADREVIVSRGELVEIGGSFRVPDILDVSGARMVEIGTTNRTRVDDYRDAMTDATGLLLKVHTSNFKVVGFTESTGVPELAALARESGVPLVVDWGSGDLVDLAPLGVRDEIPVTRLLADGADVVTFSGDKLLGGPQAGVIVGRSDLIERIQRDPFARACRIDRLLVAALHATLSAYVRGRAFEEIPTLRMLALTPEQIEGRARVIRQSLTERAPQLVSEIIDGVSRTGGGTSPMGERPTRLLSVTHPDIRANELERRLRQGSPPLVARVHDERVLVDLRTVAPERDDVVVEAILAAVGGVGTG